MTTASASGRPDISHSAILRIALPLVLSNMSEPLIGVVNTAVMGRLADPSYIGGVAVGGLIFAFLFWGFGFLRLSTGGLAAQATGARDNDTLVQLLARSLAIALAIGIGLLALSPWLGPLAVHLVGGSTAVMTAAQTYFNWRIWAAPAALANFAVMGWFIGQGRASTAFAVQLVLNCSNMALSAALVMGAGRGPDGVGLAAVISEYLAVALGLLLALRRIQALGLWPHWCEIFERAALVSLIAINRDIMIRTFLLVFAFGWFFARSARQDDVTIAANAIGINLFDVTAFMIDGFAYAAEALVGQAIGAGWREGFHRAVRLTSLWAFVLGGICALVLLVFAGPLTRLMTVNAEVQTFAQHIMPWAALSTILGTACFQLDGIFTGALASRHMRNMMLLSLIIYMLAWYWLEPAFGNAGLWAALNVFFLARAATFASRLPAIERKVFAQSA